jgi:allantoinase
MTVRNDGPAATESTPYDLVIRNGTVVTAAEARPADVAVRRGRVAALLPPGSAVTALATLDVAGLHVLPGCVDPHAHLWEPGLCAASDFADGTRAAIAGGITTIIDHPLTIPEVVDRSVFEAKAELGERTAFCDFALHGGITGSNHRALRGLWEAGATGLKTFMCRSGSAIEELDDGPLLAALREVGSFGGTVLFHAENQRLMDVNEARLRAAGRRDFMTLAEWRPPEVEAEAINRASYFCELTGTRGVFIHTSVPEGIDMAARARRRGVRVVVETCPHYLYLTTRDLETQGPWIKCQPVVRDPARVAGLWTRLARGDIMMIGSDHGPVEPALKRRGLEDMWETQGGVPSAETMVPLMLQAVADGRLTLPELVSRTSTYAARWYGLYPRKGHIAVGSDADFTVVDLSREWQVRAAELDSPCGWTPYEGWTIRGRVRYTVVRGRTVAEDGKPAASATPGYGRFYTADHDRAGDPEYAAATEREERAAAG